MRIFLHRLVRPYLSQNYRFFAPVLPPSNALFDVNNTPVPNLRGRGRGLDAR